MSILVFDDNTIEFKRAEGKNNGRNFEIPLPENWIDWNHYVFDGGKGSNYGPQKKAKVEKMIRKGKKIRLSKITINPDSNTLQFTWEGENKIPSGNKGLVFSFQEEIQKFIDGLKYEFRYFEGLTQPQVIDLYDYLQGMLEEVQSYNP